MAKTLPEVKTRLPELVTGMEEREEEVVVTKNGRRPCSSMSRNMPASRRHSMC